MAAWWLLMEFLAGQHVCGKSPTANPSLAALGDSDGERQRQPAYRNDTGVPVPARPIGLIQEKRALAVAESAS